MMQVIEIAFWLSASLVVYSYVVYPLVLTMLAAVTRRSQRRRPVNKPEAPTNVIADESDTETIAPPRVSLVIAAYREEGVILSRINNALLMDYPADRYEIIVGVDGNEDLTGDLVRRINDPRVRLMQFPKRRGKTKVLNDCVPAATGDIIVFSDANTNMEPGAIQRLVKHFAEPEVGGVCGQLVLTDLTTGKNTDGLYWRYENFLKLREGEIGALLGVNGAIYAIRKPLFDPLPDGAINDDFIIGMRIHMKGRKLIYEGEARAFEETAPDISGEFARRIRIGTGGFQSLKWLYPLLNPLRGRIALAFWSHKVLRWLCPVFLLTAFVTNIVLAGEPLYIGLLLTQLAFYGTAWAGARLATSSGPSKLSVRLARVSSLFVAVNAALFVGMLRAIRGTDGAKWKRTARSENSCPESAGNCDVDSKASAPSDRDEVLMP